MPDGYLAHQPPGQAAGVTRIADQCQPDATSGGPHPPGGTAGASRGQPAALIRARLGPGAVPGSDVPAGTAMASGLVGSEDGTCGVISSGLRFGFVVRIVVVRTPARRIRSLIIGHTPAVTRTIGVAVASTARHRPAP